MACTQENSMIEDQLNAQWWTTKDRPTILSGLNRSTNELRLEITELTEAQWSFRENPDCGSFGG
jgi:hypothetical protein